MGKCWKKEFLNFNLSSLAFARRRALENKLKQPPPHPSKQPNISMQWQSGDLTVFCVFFVFFYSGKMKNSKLKSKKQWRISGCECECTTFHSLDSYPEQWEHTVQHNKRKRNMIAKKIFVFHFPFEFSSHSEKISIKIIVFFCWSDFHLIKAFYLPPVVSQKRYKSIAMLPFGWSIAEHSHTYMDHMCRLCRTKGRTMMVEIIYNSIWETFSFAVFQLLHRNTVTLSSVQLTIWKLSEFHFKMFGCGIHNVLDSEFDIVGTMNAIRRTS